MSEAAVERRSRRTATDGRRRLIQAAQRLSAGGTSLSALGLRELAREAGLNHNTFYRHFGHIDELGQAVAEEIATRIMAGMKEVRKNAARHADANRGAAEYFLDFVRRNPEPFVIGLRELYSTSTPMRRVIQRVLEQIAAESVQQIVGMNLVPGLHEKDMLRATTAITHYMFHRSLDYLEQPQQRAEILDQIVDFTYAQFLGALALQRSRETPRNADNSQPQATRR